MAKQQQVMTAIIYDKKGRTLSIGKNSYKKTHPLMAKYAQMAGKEHPAHDYAFLHAETSAIIKCKNLDKAYRIAIFRVLKDGTYGLAAPCKACQIAISKTNIKVIEHT